MASQNRHSTSVPQRRGTKCVSHPWQAEWQHPGLPSPAPGRWAHGSSSAGTTSWAPLNLQIQGCMRGARSDYRECADQPSGKSGFARCSSYKTPDLSAPPPVSAWAAMAAGEAARGYKTNVVSSEVAGTTKGPCLLCSGSSAAVGMGSEEQMSSVAAGVS